jgi:DNA (cytosine-5)-methyltransferase 1
VRTLHALSLFSGIGGLDLGLERAGIVVVGQVESDPYCQQVLARHWPEVPRHDEARSVVPWWKSQPRPRVDVVAGGPPCQAVSLAGLRRGDDDPRWMWPAMADTVAGLRPRYVIVENVVGLASKGLERIVADLADLGYDAEWHGIPAGALGAPHLRWRLFLVAYDATVAAMVAARLPVPEAVVADADGARGRVQAGRSRRADGALDRGGADHQPERAGEGDRLRHRATAARSFPRLVVFDPARFAELADTSWWLSRPCVCGTHDGSPRQLDRSGVAGWECGVARLVPQRSIPRRGQRIRALGNAVVPQVATYVGRALVEFDNTLFGEPSGGTS